MVKTHCGLQTSSSEPILNITVYRLVNNQIDVLMFYSIEHPPGTDVPGLSHTGFHQTTWPLRSQHPCPPANGSLTGLQKTWSSSLDGRGSLTSSPTSNPLMNRCKLPLPSRPGCLSLGSENTASHLTPHCNPNHMEKKMSDSKTCSRPIPDHAMFAASLLCPAARSALPPPQRINRLFRHLPEEQVQYKQPIPSHHICPLITQQTRQAPAVFPSHLMPPPLDKGLPANLNHTSGRHIWVTGREWEFRFEQRFGRMVSRVPALPRYGICGYITT
jgi:hypothetical protein